MKRITAFSTLVLLAFPAFASDYVLRKGKQYELCQELLEITHLPENEQIFGDYDTARDIVFPERYEHFRAVKWEPVPTEKVSDYIFAEQTKQVIEWAKNGWAKRHGKVGEIELQKTMVNFDHFTGNGDEVILRYRLPGWTTWNCLIADMETVEYRDTLNRRIRSIVQCQVFYHKGRVYHKGMGGKIIGIYEPTSYEAISLDKTYRRLDDRAVCRIDVSANWPSSMNKPTQEEQ